MRTIPVREQALSSADFMDDTMLSSSIHGFPGVRGARLDYRAPGFLRTVTAPHNDRHDPMSRLVDWARRAIATPLAAVERRLLMTPARLAHAPLFVISLPRSGSTLFHLLLVQRFRLAYFSNLMAAFPASPVTVARLTRPLGGLDPPATLDSHYG